MKACKFIPKHSVFTKGDNSKNKHCVTYNNANIGIVPIAIMPRIIVLDCLRWKIKH